MQRTFSLAEDDSVIYLRIESYDDMFSSFDIRPYTHRALSIDFLDEVKRASQDKNTDGVELIFYLPEKARNEPRESTIKERLLAHFKRHYQLLLQKKKRIVRVGASMSVAGILCMIAATFVVFDDPTKNLLSSFLVVFLEPAAWFLLWEGLNQLIFSPKEISDDLDFYQKVSHSTARIHFRTY